MSICETKTKRPADRLDYVVDYERWLEPGDTLTNATATITDTTASLDDVEFSDTAARVWIAGGADGERGEVKITITTQAGRVKVASFYIQIREHC